MSDRLKLPPVSTLLGSTWKNFRTVLKNQPIDPEYKGKVLLTSLVVLIATPFHHWENLIYNRKRLSRVTFDKPPLFILGHWRSGTTLLHNMLCQDPDSSYVTTYQSVFPNNLASKAVFRTLMKIAMPDRRPADNMKLDVSLPQEDEFALSNMYHNNYYNFFYFPDHYQHYYEHSVDMHLLSERQKEEWFSWYHKMLKKAYLNTKGKRLIVKNPVNTGRVKILTEKFPDAKYLFIYRNPITVFLSTQKFFKAVLQGLMLRRVDDRFIDQMIFDVYERMMDHYLAHKHLIPADNLFELRYENFEKEPVQFLEIIYRQLMEDDFQRVEQPFKSFFESTKNHQKQRYEVDSKIIDQIINRWGKYMELFHYDVPREIKIKK